MGIKATDVEDLIFLTQRIREYCPDTVVFTFSTDLRFLHSDINRDLEGMLVFSTYPLFPFNQFWTYPFAGAKFEFFNEEAEGVFNATLIQLGARDKMVEYGEPFTASPEWPALWVSAVGRHDIWPLAFHKFELTRRATPISLALHRFTLTPRDQPRHVVSAKVEATGRQYAIPISLALLPAEFPYSRTDRRVRLSGCKLRRSDAEVPSYSGAWTALAANAAARRSPPRLPL